MEVISRLAYLSDIFDTLNHMNMFFQSPNSIIAYVVAKMQTYQRKLDLWTTSIEVKQFKNMFKNLSSILLHHSEKLVEEICCHLKLLKTELMHHFSNIDSSQYVSNLFFVDPSALPLRTRKQNEIIDIQSDNTAKIWHKEYCPINFYIPSLFWLKKLFFSC